MKMRLRQRRRLFLLVAGLIAVFAGCSSSSQSPAAQLPPSPSQTPSATPSTAVETVTPTLDVPYVPTPHNVVAKMLEMAKIKQNDIVYDLGSGDGRIVITAAQKYGA